MGNRAKDSVRLFMVPGMGHCPGGNGPSTFDLDTIAMLDQWKSTGQAPDQLIAQHRTAGQADRKNPGVRVSERRDLQRIGKR